MERLLRVGDVYRYPRPARAADPELDGYPNYFHVTASLGGTLPSLLLEAGINVPADVTAVDGARRPVISLRSSPSKAGNEVTPWHDEYDLDHGHVRYFGDHKVSTVGFPGATRGNKALLEAWTLHSGKGEADRARAAPILLWRGTPVRGVAKGYLTFCGVAVIERMETVIQRDPQTGRSYPNLSLDLAVLALADADSADTVDLRWVDDRRDPALGLEDTLRYAPASWRRWVREGRSAIPRVRRRVLTSKVASAADQRPPAGTPDSDLLDQVYKHFDGRKHAFELLASRIAGSLLARSGARYDPGWLTRSGGDGGVDFVGRLDVGGTSASTPLVVLGQAKCVLPASSISPDEVARVVARLRRGWIGVFVTTGVFSQQAQVEVVDDAYPLLLVPGRVVAEQVRLLAEESHAGNLGAFLTEVSAGYEDAIKSRRPEEILYA